MIDTTQAFFDRLAERGYEPLLHNVSGIIGCDIEDGGSWFIVVDHDSLSVGRDAVRADCVLACSREDFDRMVVGKQNPTTLFMQGRMRITGNLGLAWRFTRLFPNESLAGAEQG